MRVGVFTPLLSQLPLTAVLNKLKSLGIETVELGTGNYPGDTDCKVSMVEHSSALAEFQKILARNAVVDGVRLHATHSPVADGLRQLVILDVERNSHQKRS